ncbi:uncharacterized protein BXZ73DRAFT_98066 [Epithele typhae]|uniref:uncharacterized protein n=1 Tax=Epithele typhae TaxID=378194 RepID=UPI0020078175|nr:uncharacterized protein BXZ73DRAFT_98066 [Epithele typhae]KAH9941678.1 hypothetical protein BXZ73DRAFT_98066 [Epithele typhae]
MAPPPSAHFQELAHEALNLSRLLPSIERKVAKIDAILASEEHVKQWAQANDAYTKLVIDSEVAASRLVAFLKLYLVIGGDRAHVSVDERISTLSMDAENLESMYSTGNFSAEADAISKSFGATASDLQHIMSDIMSQDAESAHHQSEGSSNEPVQASTRGVQGKGLLCSWFSRMRQSEASTQLEVPHAPLQRTRASHAESLRGLAHDVAQGVDEVCSVLTKHASLFNEVFDKPISKLAKEIQGRIAALKAEKNGVPQAEQYRHYSAQERAKEAVPYWTDLAALYDLPDVGRGKRVISPAQRGSGPKASPTAYGFLAGKEVKDAHVGNLDLRDQRAALEWIQNGDRNRTLFLGAIMQSGAPIPVGDVKNGQNDYDVRVSEIAASSGPLSPMRQDQGHRSSDNLFHATLSGTLNLLMRYDDLSASSSVVRKKVLTGEYNSRLLEPNATASASYSTLYPRHAISTTADPSRGSIAAPDPSGTAFADLTDPLMSFPKRERAILDRADAADASTAQDERTFARRVAAHTALRPRGGRLHSRDRGALAGADNRLARTPAGDELVSSNQATRFPLPKLEAIMAPTRQACDLAEATAGRQVLTSREGKGAPKIMIALLGQDDLRPPAHLMNSYPSVLKGKALLVQATQSNDTLLRGAVFMRKFSRTNSPALRYPKRFGPSLISNTSSTLVAAMESQIALSALESKWAMVSAIGKWYTWTITYDHFLTLDVEIKHIWSRKMTSAGAIYVVIRYSSLVSNILTFLDFFPWPGKSSPKYAPARV